MGDFTISKGIIIYHFDTKPTPTEELNIEMVKNGVTKYLDLTTNPALSSCPIFAFGNMYIKDIYETIQVRFLTMVWSGKSDYGTSRAVFLGSAGSVTIGNGSAYNVCTSSRTWHTHNISVEDGIKILEATRVSLTRFHDTSSHGNASMYIEFNIKGRGWVRVLTIETGYRTGKQWETYTWNLINFRKNKTIHK